MSEQDAVNLVMQGWMKMKDAVAEETDSSTRCQVMSRMLVEEALERGSTDNITVQVVLL